MAKVIKIFNKGNNSLTVNVKLDRILQLQDQLGKKYVTYVGVLGEKTARKSDGSNNSPTNAEIGWIHEFGSYTKNIPERSFLRMPLMLYLKNEVKDSASRINKFIEAGNIVRAYALLGTSAEKVIAEAFKTGGFGHWAKLKSATISAKGSDAILIDTGQLRKSISSRVEQI